MSIAFDSLQIFLLVFVRLAGMIFLNPLFARRNIPSQARTGLVLFLTVLIAPQIDPASLGRLDGFALTIVMCKELMLGALIGYVFQVFYYMLFFAGDYMDTAFGMSMAKVFDPGTNIQMSISSNLLSYWFVFYLFATNSHLAMIHLFASSFKMLPVGAIIISPEVATYMMEVFISAFSLVIRLLLPFAVTEFILEISMGILMKVIPQIHIFVINFQLKMGMGMLMLILFAPTISGFIDNFMVLTLDTLQQTVLVAGGML